MDDVEQFRARISDPGEVAAGLPYLLGFPPTESVVLIGLGGASGGRIGLTVRADLPPPWHAAPLAGALARGAATDDPDSVIVAVVSEAADEPGPEAGADLPHRRLVDTLVGTLAEQAIPVRDALLVRGGRWWSYDCPRSCCDPGAGTPLPVGVSQLAVASVATGQVLARDRAELEERLEPTDRADAEMVASACLTVAGRRAARARDVGWEAVQQEAWPAIQHAVARRRPNGSPAAVPLTGEQLAWVVWGLRHTDLRDRALGLALGDDASAAEALWTECTRRAPSPLAAAPATLLAIGVWLRGDGAMANVALERALECDEDYRLARLLRTALAACLRPDELRAMLTETVRRLDRTTPSG